MVWRLVYAQPFKYINCCIYDGVHAAVNVAPIGTFRVLVTDRTNKKGMYEWKFAKRVLDL